jgi:hypothetical protein
MLKLNLLNLLLNNVTQLLLIWFSLIQISCKKDTMPAEPEPIVIDTVKPKISFMFVNRLGYKADTNIVRWLQSVNLYCKFYNPVISKSNLYQIIYNRNYSIYPLKDSIELIKYNNLEGAQYAYEIKIGWFYTDIQYYRELKFQTKNWPNACDTIEFSKDTIIKFVYPDDTVTNSRFIRVQ